MADNVLGTLFTDIANAIRTKTGGTDTMVPAAFPENILSIPAGGSGGAGNIKCVMGSIVMQSDGSGLIEHNMGVVPDIIYYSFGNITGDVSKETGNRLFSALGVSQAFIDAAGISNSYQRYIAFNPKNNNAAGFTVNKPMDIEENLDNVFHHVTATTAKLSTSNTPLPTNVNSRTYIAIGGLT